MTNTKQSARTKLGIYCAAILQMGIIAVAGSLSVIGMHFSDFNQTMITCLISIPCLTVIPVTLLAGLLTDYFSKKSLTLAGILLFLVGGLLPFLLESFYLILICRVVFGVGIGLLQVMCPALVAENFEGDERAAVQGKMISAQMLGCAAMSIIGGFLGSVAWNITFLVYFIGLISLVGVVLFVPNVKPVKRKKQEVITSQSENNMKKTRNEIFPWSRIAIWLLYFFLFFLVGQIISSTNSFMLADRGLGGSTEGGFCITLLALGGIVMGVFFGKFRAFFKKSTLSFGFFILGAALVIMAEGPTILIVYIGSFISGFSYSIAQPCLIVEIAEAAGNSSADKAISLGTCVQNMAQFLSPYITGAMGTAAGLLLGKNGNQMTMVTGGILSALIGFVILLLQNSKKKKGNA